MSLKYYEKLTNPQSEILCNSLCVRKQRQLNRFSNLEASAVGAKFLKSIWVPHWCPKKGAASSSNLGLIRKLLKLLKIYSMNRRL